MSQIRWFSKTIIEISRATAIMGLKTPNFKEGVWTPNEKDARALETRAGGWPNWAGGFLL
jgi:hypothetical protein